MLELSLTKLKIVVGELGPADSPAEGLPGVSVQVSDQPPRLQALLYLGRGLVIGTEFNGRLRSRTV